MGVTVMDADFVLIDGRWTEKGWLEVFRLRLTGWLPQELVVSGVGKGVLSWTAYRLDSNCLPSAPVGQI